MPLTLPAAFDTARETWDSRYHLPHALPPEAEHKVFLHRYHVNGAHWGPGRLNPPAQRGSAHPTLPGYYCVTPDTFERQEGPLVFFTRVYANIPRPWEQVSSAVVSLPGFNQAPTFATGVSITSAQAWREGLWRLTASSHGYSANDLLWVSLTASWVESGGGGPGSAGVWASTKYRRYSAEARVKAIVDTNRFDIMLGPPPINDRGFIVGSPTVSGSARKITAGFAKRPRTTRLVTTKIQHDYFWPGISADIPGRTAIPLFQPFVIQQGTETDGVFADGVLTANTVPTATDFRASIDNQADIVLDCVLEEYLPPIVDRKTTSYVAQ